MKIAVQFRQLNHEMPVLFNSDIKSFGADFQSLQIVESAPDVEHYTGEYEVTPTVDGQTLPTAQKLMENDLTIKAIPTYSVSNTSGGTTFYIATMDE